MTSSLLKRSEMLLCNALGLQRIVELVEPLPVLDDRNDAGAVEPCRLARRLREHCREGLDDIAEPLGIELVFVICIVELDVADQPVRFLDRQSQLARDGYVR